MLILDITHERIVEGVKFAVRHLCYGSVMSAIDRRSHVSDHRGEPVGQFARRLAGLASYVRAHVYRLLEAYVSGYLAAEHAETLELDAEDFGRSLENEAFRRRYSAFARLALVVVAVELLRTEVAAQGFVERTCFSNI